MSFEVNKWQELAKYNDEVHRGIIHTAEWVDKMKVAQAAFDEQVAKDIEKNWGPNVGS